MSAARAIASAAMLVALAAGCGSGPSSGSAFRPSELPARYRGIFPGLHFSYAGTAGLRFAASPRSAALPGANDLLAAGPAVLAATDRGIYRSADGGVTWRPVLAQPRLWGWSSLDQVPGGFAALGIRLGAGMRLEEGGVSEGTSPPVPVIAASSDGVHWRVHPAKAPTTPDGPLLGERIALSGLGPNSVGFAVTDPAGAHYDGPLLRTIDGGRHWAKLRALQNATSLSMLPGGRTVFAAAAGPGGRCGGAVYESTDAGKSWHLLAGSCRPYPLLAVQFLDARHGFAGGGQFIKFGGAQFFEATTDGGRTWQVRWRTGPNSGDPVVRIAMTSPSQGWMLTGGCVIGQNGPCPGTVYRTADGGGHWYGTTQRALSVVALGAGRALAGGPAGAGVASTSDGGRSWRQEDPAAWVNTSAFSGAGRLQVWANSLGTFRSSDGGRTWTSVALPAAGDTWQAAAPASLLGSGPDDASYAALTSADGGQSWARSLIARSSSPDDSLLGVVLGERGSAAAFIGPGADCLSAAMRAKLRTVKPGWRPPSGASLLYTSGDAGVRWRLAGVLPFGVPMVASAAVAGRRIAVIDACFGLWLSSDGGLNWRAQRLGNGQFCTISMLGSEIWLGCSPWLLHSTDGGADWALYRLPAALVSGTSPVPGAATSPPAGIFAVGPGTAVAPEGGSVFRTSDGGRTWVQHWPALPGE